MATLRPELEKYWDYERNHPLTPEYVSTDGKEKVFDNYEDLENYEKEAALKNAKYVYRGDPNYGVLTWSGKGRRPRWVDDYLANGGDLSEIEYPPKK